MEVTIPAGACNCCTECSGELLLGATAREFALTVSGGPTGGDFTLDVGGTSVGPIAWNIVTAEDLTVVFRDAGVPWRVRGGAGSYVIYSYDAVTIDAEVPITVTDDSLTGGTSPEVTVDPQSDGANGETMHRLGWCLTDLFALWELPLARGANVVIPGKVGRYATTRLPDETDYALPFIISGVVDEDGTIVDNQDEQLRLNTAFIAENLLGWFDGQMSTMPAQLLTPDGSATFYAQVQFGAGGASPLLRREKHHGLWIGELHMVVPHGAFVPA